MPDLSTWNLTIPQGRPAITISTSQLQRDYRSDYFQRTADGIRFWVPVNGSHTRNSEFPRSELRETLSSGRPYNWRYARADNWLEATLRIEAVPSTRRMIIGQIHSDGSNSGQAAPLVKLLYQLRLDQGRVQALVRERPDDGGTRAYTLMDGIPLGQSFSYRIGVSRSGLLSVSVNGSALEQQLDPQWAYQGLYFKAGLYLQDNRGLRVVVALRNCQIWQARKKENLARKKISVFFQGEIGRAIWRFWYFSTGSRLGVSPRINVTFCAAPFRVCTIGIALAG